jgi:hypothetical protein
MRASNVVIPVVTLVAGLACGGALGYALGARTAMERERAAVEAALQRERAALEKRAASAVPQVRSLVQERLHDPNRAQGDASAQQVDASHPLIEASREKADTDRQRLDPSRQRCVGGYVRERVDGADEKGRRIGERDLLENGRRVECSGLLRK